MAAGFICGISIAVYGKPWTLWLLFFGILLWSAIVTGHDRGMPESDRYPWFGNGGGVWRYVLPQHYFWAGITAGVCRQEQNQYLPYLEDGEENLLKGKLTGKRAKKRTVFIQSIILSDQTGF